MSEKQWCAVARGGVGAMTEDEWCDVGRRVVHCGNKSAGQSEEEWCTVRRRVVHSPEKSGECREKSGALSEDEVCAVGKMWCAFERIVLRCRKNTGTKL